MRSRAARAPIRHRLDGPAWRQFPRAHAAAILAAGFLHAGTVLLSRLHVLAFTGHGTRRMHPAGVTATRPVSRPSSRPATWPRSRRAARGLANQFLIRGRGPDFTASFDAVFRAAGTTILDSAAQAPPMNATCERLAGTLRRELPGRSLIPGERHLRAVLTEHQEHYNTARPHQGTGQRVPDTAHHVPCVITAGSGSHQTRGKPVLTGLINEYVRAA
ncbi:MAG: integrase core domain-containing protein [Streptosporangiaceae bacterium]